MFFFSLGSKMDIKNILSIVCFFRFRKMFFILSIGYFTDSERCFLRPKLSILYFKYAARIIDTYRYIYHIDHPTASSPLRICDIRHCGLKLRRFVGKDSCAASGGKFSLARRRDLRHKGADCSCSCLKGALKKCFSKKKCQTIVDFDFEKGF